MITATWHATSGDELRQIGGWVHDASFDWERIDFDPAAGVVTVPFDQEPTDEQECGQRGPRLVERGRVGSRIYKVPFVRCSATVRHATTCVIDERNRADPGMLNVLEPQGSREIAFVPVTGPEVRIAIDTVDVQIEMTDELAFHVRRTTTWLGESDVRWNEASAE
jgi:hypothetical protein